MHSLDSKSRSRNGFGALAATLAAGRVKSSGSDSSGAAFIGSFPFRFRGRLGRALVCRSGGCGTIRCFEGGVLLRRVGIFGWGVVAPRSPNVDAFAANLASTESWLEPFNGFGPDNFLVGVPDFRFADYRDWIASRFPPARFHQLGEKMALPVQYAIGAFIQALGQNPGLEAELRSLGTAAHVYMGTGLGCVNTISQNTRALDRAQRRWDRFWTERNPAFQEYGTGNGELSVGLPADPATIADPEDRYEAEGAWWHHWAAS